MEWGVLEPVEVGLTGIKWRRGCHGLMAMSISVCRKVQTLGDEIEGLMGCRPARNDAIGSKRQSGEQKATTMTRRAYAEYAKGERSQVRP